ncbi:proteinase-activated receptor 3-like [Denticeps clupeoides]|uniref:G-protein coupled receptors family 1 profile domain-containing protein n=1 Tax=Denticeps clupeoides TaxID=299321 RepID=A0AAY4CZN6_9TELE|nr:proteinase-activated receptor 3-like [Denticeps clupeoides]
MAEFYSNSSVLETPSNSSAAQQTVFQYCRDMPAGFMFYLSLQFINLFLGIPANLMVLWFIHKSKSDSSTSDIFILHLAVLDTMFCLMPPLEVINIMYLNTSNILTALSFFYGVKDCSLLFLSCICLDRYMAVRHPITFTELKDRRHRAVCAAVVWLITLAYALARCVGKFPNFEKTFVVMILATFAIMVFCNISILSALRQSGPGRDEMHPVKKKAFKMVLIILAIIVFNYLPPVALFPFKQYFVPDLFICYIAYFAFGFMDISSSIQPMLYLSREKLSNFCPCKFQMCGCTTEQEVST